MAYTPSALVEAIRAKYPNAYQDKSDQELEQAFLAKYDTPMYREKAAMPSSAKYLQGKIDNYTARVGDLNDKELEDFKSVLATHYKSRGNAAAAIADTAYKGAKELVAHPIDSTVAAVEALGKPIKEAGDAGKAYTDEQIAKGNYARALLGAPVAAAMGAAKAVPDAAVLAAGLFKDVVADPFLSPEKEASTEISKLRAQANIDKAAAVVSPVPEVTNLGSMAFGTAVPMGLGEGAGAAVEGLTKAGARGIIKGTGKALGATDALIHNPIAQVAAGIASGHPFIGAGAGALGALKWLATGELPSINKVLEALDIPSLKTFKQWADMVTPEFSLGDAVKATAKEGSKNIEQRAAAMDSFQKALESSFSAVPESAAAGSIMSALGASNAPTAADPKKTAANFMAGAIMSRVPFQNIMDITENAGRKVFGLNKEDVIQAGRVPAAAMAEAESAGAPINAAPTPKTTPKTDTAAGPAPEVAKPTEPAVKPDYAEFPYFPEQVTAKLKKAGLTDDQIAAIEDSGAATQLTDIIAPKAAVKQTKIVPDDLKAVAKQLGYKNVGEMEKALPKAAIDEILAQLK